MPITIPITPHPSKPYLPPAPSPSSPEALLSALGAEYACVEGGGGVIQESVPESDLEYLTPHRNGFLRAVLDAYCGHHHLVLRPDDVWIAIVTQLKYYFQAHPETTKSHFLPNDTPGSATKRSLPINFLGSAETVNIAIIANQMTRDIQNQISDPSFREFVLPTFSTTSIEDKIICTVLMLATMDSLFDVSLSFMCGIPSLTLLGTQADWSDILQRVRPIAEEGRFGNEARHWGATLVVVLEKFVAAFAEEEGVDGEFWRNIVRYTGGVDGGEGVIGGWITAFARWGPTSSSSSSTNHEWDSLPPPSPSPTPSSHSQPYYTHTSLKFPTISPSRIPSAIASLDFPLIDEGAEKKARLIAGHVGKTWFGVKGDTVQPCPVWMLYLPKPVPVQVVGGGGGGGGGEEKMSLRKAAMSVMHMRSRKKSTTPAPEEKKEKEKEVIEPIKVGALGAGVAAPGTAVGKGAVASSEEEKSRWHRLVQHTRKLSEKH